MKITEITSQDRLFVTICAWCDDCADLTKEYADMGYTVSHGICRTHADELKREMGAREARQ